MRVVWKATLPAIYNEIQMPKGAKLLHVAAQYGNPTIWFECDPNAEKARRIFRVVMTGLQAVEDGAVYVGTAQIPSENLALFQEIVAHVYESES